MSLISRLDLMDYLEQKSNFNIYSAEELIKLTYFAPSVHCAYYAALQYMKFVLCHFIKKPYEQIDAECKAHTGRTHVYLADNIVEALQRKVKDRDAIRDFKNKIKQLKTFRTNSDYHNIQILVDEATKSLMYSKEIIDTIKLHITK